MRKIAPVTIPVFITLAMFSCEADPPPPESAFTPRLDEISIFGVGDENRGSTEREGVLLQLPAFLRFGIDQRIWTLDTGRKAAVAFKLDTGASTIIGSEGRGPGELRVSAAMDVSPGGIIWIGDVGNGKVVGFRNGTVVSEFVVNHQPFGLVAPTDSVVWVVGDLMNSLMVRYDLSGERLGEVGVPVNVGREWFRSNQGTAARGTGACAVVWAYTYHSLLHCFSADGEMLWSTSGPVEIEQSRESDPNQMSPNDLFAYIDIVAHAGRVYGLFVGGRPGDGGLNSRTVHVFRSDTGAFVGVQTLPQPAKYIARTDSSLALVTYEPTPRIVLYSIDSDEQ